MERKRRKKEHQSIIAANRLDDPLDKLRKSPKSFKCGKDGQTCVLRHYKIQDLSVELLKWFMDLMTRNVEEMYSLSSWGWNPRKKKKEMTEDRARYLIVFIDEKPVAFSHFRFDMDYGRPVVYCYEVQVEPAAQSMKLGTHLVKVLEALASRNNIPLVVLTVLCSNLKGLGFFRNLGYTDDEMNLTESKQDYIILSKIIS